jgi:DNA mismatch endonuclease (patch repair protein)
MALIKAGLKGWVLHPSEVFGMPDIFFPKKKLAIFVDGCFWHGCPECGHVPKTRPAFWRTKFQRNQVRSKLVNSELRKGSIKVARFWEHAFKGPSQTKRAIRIISKYLGG